MTNKEAVYCSCVDPETGRRVEAVQQVTRKSRSNRGRWYASCDKCDYFRWIDDIVPTPEDAVFVVDDEEPLEYEEPSSSSEWEPEEKRTRTIPVGEYPTEPAPTPPPAPEPASQTQ